MLRRYYTLMLLPVVVTILLAYFVPDINATVTAPIGKVLGLEGVALGATGPAALYFALVLIGPALLRSRRDELESVRKALRGKWHLKASKAGSNPVKGTVSIKHIKETGRLFIEGTFQSEDGKESEWRGRQIYLDRGTLSFVLTSKEAKEFFGAQRTMLDFQFADQPDLRKLDGTWHAIDGIGTSEAIISR